jgi:transcriptional regulator with XRE-family HTH domain
MPFDGKLCRAARAALDISNAELAELANVGVNTISRFERGLDVRVSSARALQSALEKMGAVFVGSGQLAPIECVGVRAEPD